MFLILEDVRVVYSRGTPFERVALKNVNLTITSDRICTVVGKNGSGKTTLLQTIALLIKPSSGRVFVNGVDPWSEGARPFRKKIGFSFQFPENQMFASTVAEEVSFAALNYGLPDVERKVRCALERIGLEPELYLERSPFTLSGGEKRKVALASITVHDPDLLVLDEPMAGLDWPSRREFLDFLKDWKESGKGAVIATHHPDLFTELVDCVIEVSDGEVRVRDTPPDDERSL